MAMTKATADPFLYEVLSHRLHHIAVEMGMSLERVGGTVNTTQQHDYMAALYRANGDILAAGESMAMHVACGGVTVKKMIARFSDAEGINEDDVFLLNDPYVSAVHQSDVYLVSPIHSEGKLVAWSASFVHVMDIGAMSPGGESPGATNICQEGVRIPGIKIVERGELRRDIFDAITNMTRQPRMVGLDLKSELAANNVAKARMQEMMAQYGVDLIDEVSLEMIEKAETTLRSRIRNLADGSYTESAIIQSDATNKWTVKLTTRKVDDHFEFDFDGTDDQAPIGINLPIHATFGTCFGKVLDYLAYDLPKNHGLFLPIEVSAPEGTLVHVKYPGPVSMNTTSIAAVVSQLASSTIMHLLRGDDRWAREIMAVTPGHRNARTSGTNQYGMYYASGMSQSPISGRGATSFDDGVDCGKGGFMSAPDVEWTESNYPLLFLYRRGSKDTVGAGQYRGGTGAEEVLMVHDAPERRLQCIAYGVAGLANVGQGFNGGYPAAPSVLVLHKDTKIDEFIENSRYPSGLEELGGSAETLPYCDFELRSGDLLYYRLSGGGGYGDPLERDPDSVLQDINDGIISQEFAQSIYGVVVQNDSDGVLETDADETERTRSQARKLRLQD